MDRFENATVVDVLSVSWSGSGSVGCGGGGGSRTRVRMRTTLGLLPRDVESLTGWYDDTKERDAMLEATHTEQAPWYPWRAGGSYRRVLSGSGRLLRARRGNVPAAGPLEIPRA